ncbi:MAG: NAD(P)/FAD-dependent oxidoreductase [Mycobacterium sp.]
MTRKLRCAVIGAGMAGILAAIKLREDDVGDVVIFEKGQTYGGTWRENHYPGLACDVPSHLYSYSFAPNPEWSRRFSPGPEIKEYFARVARDHGLDPITRFGEEVVSCRWEDGRWHLETQLGDVGYFDLIMAATGVLHHPNIPALPGLETFEGQWFHSTKWNHDVPLDGRKVGVIGTGSTAIQITGALVDRVEHYTLFQRTPQWIAPQSNAPYSDEEREAFRNDPMKMLRKREEYAKIFTEGFANSLTDPDSPEMHLIEDMCRQHLESAVTDEVLREQLRPDYRAGCKRLVLSGDFYPAIQRPNASLVTAKIDHVEPAGVRTEDGVLHELDVLVLATGFRVDRFVRPIRVLGADGCDLDEVWSKHPTAYVSVSVPGFPNFFMLNGPNGPVGNFSLIDVAEIQMSYVMQLVDEIRRQPSGGLAATRTSTDEFERARREAARTTIWMTGCNSWYLDDEGVPATWPWTFDHFRKTLSSPDLEHYEHPGA